ALLPEQEAAQVGRFEQAAVPQPTSVSPHQQYARARQDALVNRQLMEKQANLLGTAKANLEKARQQYHEAVAASYDVDEAEHEALLRYNRSVGVAVAVEAGGKKFVFEIDLEDLSQNIDDYEEQGQQAIRAFKADAEKLEQAAERAEQRRVNIQKMAEAQEAAADKAQQAKEGAGEEEACALVFGSVTEWGKSTLGFARQLPREVQGFLAAETHVVEAELEAERQTLQNATPAIPSRRAEIGSRGGEWIMMRSHLATTTFEGRRAAASAAGKASPFVGFAPTTLHLKSGNVVVVSAYFFPGVPLAAGGNSPLLRSLAIFLRSIADAWMVLADWSVVPSALEKTTWPELVRGSVVIPQGCTITCDRGKGSMIDGGVVSLGAEHCFRLEACRQFPWKTRVGLKPGILGAARAWDYLQLVTPRPWPARRRPPIAPGPGSERSRVKKEEAAAMPGGRWRVARSSAAQQQQGQEISHAIEQMAQSEDDLHQGAAAEAAYAIPAGCWHAAQQLVAQQPLRLAAASPQARAALRTDGEECEALSDLYARWVSALGGGARLMREGLQGKAAKAMRGAGKGLEYFGKQRVPEEVADWRQLLAGLVHAGEAELELFSMQSSRWAARAAGRAQVKAGQQRSQWVGASWRSSSGPVRRRAKGERPARLETLPPGGAVAGPMGQMQLREGRWSAVWTSRSFDETKLRDWPAPRRGVQQWVDLLREVEAAVMWPRQVLTTILSLLPTSRGCDRAIGLLPLLAKCWSCTRATVTDEWSGALEQHWDMAIGGSSALRAALCLSVLDGSAVAMGFCAIAALVDLERFFDSIDLIALLEVAGQGAFSAVVVSLGAQAYLAPRRLRRHGWCSGQISAERSIVAGSSRGVTVGKLFLCPFLQRVGAGSPCVELQTFVDDAILGAEGLERVAADQMVDALGQFGMCCNAAQLTISDESVVVASDMDAAQQVVAGAGEPGLPLKAVGKAVGLVVSTAVSKRRGQSQFQKRAKTAARRLHLTHRMRRKARLGKCTRMPRKTGVQPALIYGHQVFGVAPTALLKLRRPASRAMAGRGFGRCLATTLALALGE
ncbi:unnamed protein product, partial [Prorocentrum cordatum]